MVGMPRRRWDPIQDGMHLLNLGTGQTTKEDIEKAFRVVAKRHHPDSASFPDPIKFRECLEARNLLLDHYHSIHRRQRQTGMTQQYSQSYNSYKGSSSIYSYLFRHNDKTGGTIFVKGFPFSTLHLLTTRSKLQLKAATMVLVLGMGLFDGYTRWQYRKAVAKETSKSSATATGNGMASHPSAETTTTT